MPPLRKRVLAEMRSVGPVPIEHLPIESGDVLVREFEQVVGLDIDTAQGEIGRSGKHSKRFAIAACNQHLVVLQVAEVHALDVAGAGAVLETGRTRRFAGRGVAVVGGIIDDGA
jgi:hypothetical protein